MIITPPEMWSKPFPPARLPLPSCLCRTPGRITAFSRSSYTFFRWSNSPRNVVKAPLHAGRETNVVSSGLESQGLLRNGAMSNWRTKRLRACRFGPLVSHQQPSFLLFNLFKPGQLAGWAKKRKHGPKAAKKGRAGLRGRARARAASLVPFKIKTV